LSSTTKDKRIRRVERRAIPEVAEAMRNGQISVRLADTLLCLSPREQRAQLDRRLRLAQERERKSNAIAGVIRGYLDAHKEIDLEALRSLIQAALARASVGN
jgi:hypothetical protein